MLWSLEDVDSKNANDGDATKHISVSINNFFIIYSPII